jgi:ribonuclease E
LVDAPSDVTVPGTIIVEPSPSAPRSRWPLALAGALVLASGLGGAAWVSQRGSNATTPATDVEAPSAPADAKRSRVEIPEPGLRAKRTDDTEPAIDAIEADAAQPQVVVDEDERPRARPRKRAKPTKKADREPAPATEPVDAAPIEPAPLEPEAPASGTP